MAKRKKKVPSIRATPFLDVQMLPQAIFARPIESFAPRIEEGQDDLDLFRYADFSLNNSHHFSLRSYRGFPKWLVSLYLELAFAENVTEIRRLILEIVEGLALPKEAVTWQRGEPLDKELKPPVQSRLREPEARVLTLKIAAQCEGHEATMSFIKSQVPKYVELSPIDLEPSPSRAGERKWQQIVGNVVSHEKSVTSIFSRKLAVRHGDYIRVTKRGLDYLNNVGFSVR